MASVWGHSFICTFYCLQRRDRNARECSHNVAVLATGSTIPTPWAHRRTMLFRDCTSQLFEHYHSWFCELSVTSSSALLFLTLLFSSPLQERAEKRTSVEKWKGDRWRVPGVQGFSGIHCCPTETTAAARQRPGLAQEGREAASPWWDVLKQSVVMHEQPLHYLPKATFPTRCCMGWFPIL